MDGKDAGEMVQGKEGGREGGREGRREGACTYRIQLDGGLVLFGQERDVEYILNSLEEGEDGRRRKGGGKNEVRINKMTTLPVH